MYYKNRIDAGRALAEQLENYQGDPQVIVLGLPRGGVVVAAEVARQLGAPLDILVVRKLGHPLQRELAIGAIATGGIRVENEEVIRETGVDESSLARIEAEERTELLRREAAYRGQRPAPDLQGKCVILVDDGLATGSTMHAALLAVRAQRAQRVVVAVPVAPTRTWERFRRLADAVVCPMVRDDFMAIGEFYEEFLPTPDDEVQRLLAGSPGTGQSAAAPPESSG
jgi:predicted phosphoribosyltransferase